MEKVNSLRENCRMDWEVVMVSIICLQGHGLEQFRQIFFSSKLDDFSPYSRMKTMV